MGCVGGKSDSAAVVADCNKQDILVLRRDVRMKYSAEENPFEYIIK